MYYDKEREEAAQVLATVVELRGDANVALFGSIMSALYDVANELHEINLSLRAGVNNGR